MRTKWTAFTVVLLICLVDAARNDGDASPLPRRTSRRVRNPPRTVVTPRADRVTDPRDEDSNRRHLSRHGTSGGSAASTRRKQTTRVHTDPSARVRRDDSDKRNYYDDNWRANRNRDVIDHALDLTQVIADGIYNRLRNRKNEARDQMRRRVTRYFEVKDSGFYDDYAPSKSPPPSPPPKQRTHRQVPSQRHGSQRQHRQSVRNRTDVPARAHRTVIVEGQPNLHRAATAPTSGEFRTDNYSPTGMTRRVVESPTKQAPSPTYDKPPYGKPAYGTPDQRVPPPPLATTNQQFTDRPIVESPSTLTSPRKFRSLVQKVPFTQYPRVDQSLLDQTGANGEKIGDGCGGTIYKVRRTKDGPLMAMKVMTHWTKSREAIEAMELEIDLMYSMRTKYVTRIHERFSDDKNIYIIMDLAPFGDGFDMVSKMRSFFTVLKDRELMAKLAMRDIVRGLRELHSFGYVHHDLKWENILIFTTHLAVADFGLVVPLITHHLENQISGTLKTLPPELVPIRKGSFYDDRGDIWSLGALLIELIYGYNPYDDNDDDVVIDRIQRKRIFELPKAYSDDLYDFIHRCLTHYRYRFDNIEEVYQHRWFDEVREFNVEEDVSPWRDIYLIGDPKRGEETLEIIRETYAHYRARMKLRTA